MQQKISRKFNQISENFDFNSEHVFPMDYGILRGFVSSPASARDAMLYTGVLAAKSREKGVLCPRLGTLLIDVEGVLVRKLVFSLIGSGAGIVEALGQSFGLSRPFSLAGSKLKYGALWVDDATKLKRITKQATAVECEDCDWFGEDASNYSF